MLGYFNLFKRKLGYLGWNSRGNLGDEALYTIIRRMIKPVELVKYKLFYRKGKFLEGFQEKCLSGFMMGAGTLINNPTLLRLLRHFNKMKKPTFVFGAGVLDPEFYCQFPEYTDEMYEWAECLHSCSSVSVRGPLSSKILRSYGYESAKIISDPVLSFASDQITPAGLNNIIGINFGTTKNGLTLWGKSDENVKRFVIRLANVLIEKGQKVRFFPVWKDDVRTVISATKEVKGDVKVWSHSENMAHYIKAMEQIDIFIGEKLHSVIGALCAYRPSIMLAYQPKCVDFMQSVSLEDFVVRTDRLDLDEVLSKIDKIQKNYECYRKNLFEQISKWKLIQRQIAVEIVKMVLEYNRDSSSKMKRN